MLTLRQAEDGGCNSVLTVLNEALRKKREYGDDAWGDGLFTAEEIIPKIKKSELYVAVNDNEVVGVVVLQDSDENMWDSDGLDGKALYVHQLSSVIKGVGSEMLKLVELEAAKRDRQFVRLDCNFENTNLYNYYVQHGYIEVRRIDTESHKSAFLQKIVDKNQKHDIIN